MQSNVLPKVVTNDNNNSNDGADKNALQPSNALFSRKWVVGSRPPKQGVLYPHQMATLSILQFFSESYARLHLTVESRRWGKTCLGRTIWLEPSVLGPAWGQGNPCVFLTLSLRAARLSEQYSIDNGCGRLRAEPFRHGSVERFHVGEYKQAIFIVDDFDRVDTTVFRAFEATLRKKLPNARVLLLSVGNYNTPVLAEYVRVVPVRMTAPTATRDRVATKSRKEGNGS